MNDMHIDIRLLYENMNEQVNEPTESNISNEATAQNLNIW